jgi:hypothetical protein
VGHDESCRADSLFNKLDAMRVRPGVALNENTFRMPDHPWKDRDPYIRNSPWFFLDKVETPLLLIHSTDDTAALVNQSNELFLGLRRLGKTVQYARYVMASRRCRIAWMRGSGCWSGSGGTSNPGRRQYKALGLSDSRPLQRKEPT